MLSNTTDNATDTDSYPSLTPLQQKLLDAHGHAPRQGVLLVNLGTPDAPDPASVKRYLREFLSDPRIVELPRMLWWLILNGIILNIRPRRSAKAYQKVWTEQGSPLLTYSQQQQQQLAEQLGSDWVVELAMRYGNPSISEALVRLQAQHVQQVLVIPLYPQYSATTTASVFDGVAQALQKQRWIPELRFINSYHDHPAYIQAMKTHIEQHWAQHSRQPYLVFSFHGIPKKYLHKGDPYHCQAHKSARLLAEALNLSTDQYRVVFQSRFGREEWLKPYADKTFEQLAAEGFDHIQVFCPGFAVDCLETIEEVAMENRDLFMEHGGQQFDYIPALNAAPAHIDMLDTLVKQHTQGWHQAATNADAACPHSKALAAQMITDGMNV